MRDRITGKEVDSEEAESYLFEVAYATAYRFKHTSDRKRHILQRYELTEDDWSAIQRQVAIMYDKQGKRR